MLICLWNGINGLNFTLYVSLRQQLNTLDAAPGDGTFLTAAEIRALTPTKEDITRVPDYTFWLNFNFYGKDMKLLREAKFLCITFCCVSYNQNYFFLLIYGVCLAVVTV